MSGAMVTFVVPGASAPQGSKTPWGTEANSRTRPWRAEVKAAALEALARRGADGAGGHGYYPPMLGPVGVEIQLHFVRPASHFGTGRNAGRLKPSAPAYVTSYKLGDWDKHARAISDALQDAGVVRNDAQIAAGYVVKLYDERAFALITVRELGRAQPMTGTARTRTTEGGTR